MIYLNNAETSYPKPVEVIKSVTRNIQNIPYRLTPYCLETRKNINVVDKCRMKLARLINVNDPNDIIFTSGATEAINLVIKGLPIKNSHIITTNIEHNSVLRPLYAVAREKNIDITIVNADENGYLNIDDVRSAIQPNTKAIIVNHASNVLGTVNNLGKISELARKNKLFFVVDASQTIGRIPIDLGKYNIDFLAFSGHKGLYGISGIGGLYIKKSLDIKPLKIGGTGNYLSGEIQQPRQRPIYYESGTMNFPGIASLEAGVTFILDKGIKNIMRQDRILLEYVVESLKQVPSVTLYLNSLKDKRLPIVSLNIENKTSCDVGYLLEKTFGIIINTGLHCSPLIHKQLGTYPSGTVRVSLSYFNTIEDVNYFIESIQKISHSSNIFKRSSGLHKKSETIK